MRQFIPPARRSPLGRPAAGEAALDTNPVDEMIEPDRYSQATSAAGVCRQRVLTLARNTQLLTIACIVGSNRASEATRPPRAPSFYHHKGWRRRPEVDGPVDEAETCATDVKNIFGTDCGARCFQLLLRRRIAFDAALALPSSGPSVG